MYPVPTISELSAYSGRDEATYATAIANTALLQATIRFAVMTEITDPSQIEAYQALSQADMQLMAKQGILSLADNIYLQFPYQQVMASPLNSESIGSRHYQKTATFGMGGSMSRMAPAALELSMENTGVPMFDMAVRVLARRTLMAGVFHEGMTIFEEGSRDSRSEVSQAIENATGRRWILGPADRDQFPLFPGGDVNAQSFPADPSLRRRKKCSQFSQPSPSPLRTSSTAAWSLYTLGGLMPRGCCTLAWSSWLSTSSAGTASTTGATADL